MSEANPSKKGTYLEGFNDGQRAILAERDKAIARLSACEEALREIIARDPLDAMNHGMTFPVDATPSDIGDKAWQLAVARSAERGTNGAARIATAALKEPAPARTDAGKETP